MNITTKVLLVIGTILFFTGIFRKELPFSQKRNIVSEREQYLPILRDIVEKILAKLDEIALKASRLPLEDYYNKYLRLNKSYQKAYGRLPHKDTIIRRKVAIVVALVYQNFHKFNPYMSELEHSSGDLLELRQELDNLISRCGDNSLNREVKHLFKAAGQYHRVFILAELGLNNGLDYKASKYYENLYKKPEVLKPFVKYYHDRVNKRIEYLKRGDDQ